MLGRHQAETIDDSGYTVNRRRHFQHLFFCHDMCYCPFHDQDAVSKFQVKWKLMEIYSLLTLKCRGNFTDDSFPVSHDAILSGCNAFQLSIDCISGCFVRHCPQTGSCHLLNAPQFAQRLNFPSTSQSGPDR